MLELVSKVFDFIRILEKKFGIKTIITYSVIIAIIGSMFNLDAIVTKLLDYGDMIEMKRHDRDLNARAKINEQVHLYLIELRVRLNADRVMLYEFHNSVSNLIGIPFKYISLSAHAEPYGIELTPKYDDVNSEVIGKFIRNLQNTMFYHTDDIENLRRMDPFVPEVLNDPKALSSGYQYISALNKPLGILVVEYHNPNKLPNNYEWSSIRNMCSKASQDLNSIIVKYKN